MRGWFRIVWCDASIHFHLNPCSADENYGSADHQPRPGFHVIEWRQRRRRDRIPGKWRYLPSFTAVGMRSFAILKFTYLSTTYHAISTGYFEAMARIWMHLQCWRWRWSCIAGRRDSLRFFRVATGGARVIERLLDVWSRASGEAFDGMVIYVAGLINISS